MFKIKHFNLATPALIFIHSFASAQELQYPVDIAVSADQQIFVADHGSHQLLRFKDGVFETVTEAEGLPRTALFGIRHIEIDKDGSCIASDPATMKLYRVSSSGQITVVPDDDRFVTPWGLAIEKDGSILVVDRVTRLLRRIRDGEVEDVQQIQAPRAVRVDSKGAITVLTDQNLFRLDEQGSSPVLEVSPFEFPHDFVQHQDGNFYVSDGYAKAIWQIDPKGSAKVLIQGSPLQSPQGMAVDAKGNLLVADAHARKIFIITTKGVVTELGGK